MANEFLKKCQQLQADPKFSNDMVNVCSYADSFAYIAITKQTSDNKTLNPLYIYSTDANATTRIELLIKHGYKQQVEL